jgi:hypothetical protein
MYYLFFQDKICHSECINDFLYALLRTHKYIKHSVYNSLIEHQWVDFNQNDIYKYFTIDNTLKNDFFDYKIVNDYAEKKHHIVITHDTLSIINNYCSFNLVKFNEKKFENSFFNNWAFIFLNTIDNKPTQININILKDEINVFFSLFTRTNIKDLVVYNNVKLILLIFFASYRKEEPNKTIFTENFFKKIKDTKNIVNVIKKCLPDELREIGDLFRNNYRKNESLRKKLKDLGFVDDFWNDSYKKSLYFVQKKIDNYNNFRLLYIPAILSLGVVGAYELYKRNKQNK